MYSKRELDSMGSARHWPRAMGNMGRAMRVLHRASNTMFCSQIAHMCTTFGCFVLIG